MNNRIPIVSWFRSQATESLAHAHEAGEWITALGAHPSLAIGPLLETHKHKINEILKESAETEKTAMDRYYALMQLVKDRNVALEEYSRKMIYAEEMHLTEVEKMLWTAGSA